jgi:hypothetical protein
MAWTVSPAETGMANLIAENYVCSFDHSPEKQDRE